MNEQKKFYRTVVTVTVLSENPLGDDLGLGALEYAITEGDCSGVLERTSEVGVDAKAMASLLLEQGSDPSFFGLHEYGQQP